MRSGYGLVRSGSGLSSWFEFDLGLVMSGSCLFRSGSGLSIWFMSDLGLVS